MVTPASRNSVMARARFCTWAILTSSNAPEADFASVPLSGGLWRRVVTTPIAPKAAAERRMAPALWGVGDLIEQD